MGKKQKKTQQFVGRQGGNTPSFLKKQNEGETDQKNQKENNQLDDSSSDEDNQPVVQVKKVEKTQNKREIKQEQKQRVKESRELGLATGITRNDIEKFNELLRKHGDGEKAYQYTIPGDQQVEKPQIAK